jgi:hypothetical protein
MTLGIIALVLLFWVSFMLNVVMLSVANKPFMLNVVVLSVFMLSVFMLCRYAEFRGVLERPARDKRSSLLSPLASYDENEVLWIRTLVRSRSYLVLRRPRSLPGSDGDRRIIRPFRRLRRQQRNRKSLGFSTSGGPPGCSGASSVSDWSNPDRVRRKIRRVRRNGCLVRSIRSLRGWRMCAEKRATIQRLITTMPIIFRVNLPPNVVSQEPSLEWTIWKVLYSGRLRLYQQTLD